jgi:predicted MPP superfamily phosphohydrolase
VVTSGVGTSHLRFRLGAPPEIVVLEFPGGAR